MFGLGPLSTRSQPPVSAPPNIVYSTSSPDSNGFWRMPSSTKGKHLDFLITEPEDTAPQTQWTANIPEGPRSASMSEDLFFNKHPSLSAKMNTPLTTGTMTHSSSSSQDSTCSVFQFPQAVDIAKNHSPQAALTIQSQVPNHFRPAPTPLLSLHQRSQHSTHKAQAGPIQYPLAATFSSASGDLPKFEPAYLCHYGRFCLLRNRSFKLNC